MRLRLFIISILLAGYLYPQDFDWDWYKVSNKHKRNNLITLTANTDTVWAGGYMATHNASDTANLGNGTFVYFMGGNPRLKIRETGTIYKVNFYIFDTSLITSFKILYLRHTNSYVNGVFVTDSVFTGEEMKTLLVNGDNTITLTQPVAVQSDDVYAVEIIGTGNAISVPFNSSFNSYSFASAQANTNGKNWAAGTLQAGRYFPIKFYMQAPVFIAIGDSWVDGIGKGIANVSTTSPIAYVSGASSQPYSNNQYYNSKHTQWYGLSLITGWTYQNMGVSSQTSTQINARFATDATALKPKIAIIDGGTNDITLYSVAIFANIKKMIDSCRAHSIIPIVCGTIPVTSTGYPDSTMRIDDSVDVLTQNYCNSLGVYFFNVKNVQGRFRTGGDVGNKWGVPQWFMAGDSVHTNRNCNSVIARHLFDYLKTKYALSDTANAYSQHTALTDTVKADFPLYLRWNTFSLKGFDSCTIDWYTDSITSTHVTMVIDSAGQTVDWWGGYISPDTSKIASGNHLTYTITGYGYRTISTNVTITLTDRVYDADYLTFNARRTTPQTGWFSGIENDFVKDSRALGTFDSLDFIHIYASNVVANALFDWTVNAFDATVVNSPAWTQYQGYLTATVGSKYINCGYAPATDSVHFRLLNCTMGFYCRTNVYEAHYDMGTQTTPALNVVAAYNPTGFFIYMNQNAVLSVNASSADPRGFWAGSRTASNVVTGYHNKDSVKAGTNVATSIPTGNLFTGATNNGSGTPLSICNKEYSMDFAGRLSTAQILILETAFNRYMTRIGKNVY